MGRYIVQRILLVLPNLVLVTLFVFFLLRLVPGDIAADVLGPLASHEQYAEFRQEHGLNKPVYEQYADWALKLLQGDLGTSLRSNFSVTSEFVRHLPVTLEIVIIAFTFATSMGILFGIISAVNQNTPLDYTVRLIALFGLSIPGFLLLTVLLIVPARFFAYSPPFGANSLFEDPWDNLRLYVPPALVLGFGSATSLMRITRTAFLDVLRQDYMRTARAKGLDGRTVILRHGLRNVLAPIVTVAGVHLGNLLAGSVIVEAVMALPGLGTWSLMAIQSQDYPIVMAFALYVAFVMILINLVIDLLYSFIDPRVRLD